ncbi:hypothetical protein ANCDUO_09552 [Ancylostoma duodenale]|uniref:Uncharacterized protein n=1 Tax=Ancylostoma duodenale TaxID=51022 RepID=A0A0C2GMG7_9BILA|nr:hypothetical protein ANCDUO_09552 [Ancylostoma duodenale]
MGEGMIELEEEAFYRCGVRLLPERWRKGYISYISDHVFLSSHHFTDWVLGRLVPEINAVVRAEPRELLEIISVSSYMLNIRSPCGSRSGLALEAKDRVNLVVLFLVEHMPKRYQT